MLDETIVVKENSTFYLSQNAKNLLLKLSEQEKRSMSSMLEIIIENAYLERVVRNINS